MMTFAATAGLHISLIQLLPMSPYEDLSLPTFHNLQKPCEVANTINILLKLLNFQEYPFGFSLTLSYLLLGLIRLFDKSGQTC